MKKNLFANFEILILFSFFSLICLQRIQFSPLNNDFDEEEFNPINGLFGINNMAKNLISIYINILFDRLLSRKK